MEESFHPKKHSVERDNTSSIVNATTLSQTFTNLTDGVKNLKNHRNFRIKIPLVKEKYDRELYENMDIQTKCSIKSRVKEAAINAKKELSTQLTTTINIPFLLIRDNKPVN